MKIVAFPSDRAGCGYLRMFQPYTYLRDKLSYDVRFADRTDCLVAIEPDVDVYAFQLVSNQSVVDFQREVRIHRPNAKTVMDLDDHLRAIPKSNISVQIGAWGEGNPKTKTLLTFIEECDLLTVSTPDLAEEYKRFNPNIRVLYNSIQDEEVERLKPEITGRPKREGQIRIGYGASATHHADFAMVLKPLVRAMRDYPQTRMVFIGADFCPYMPRDLYAQCEYAGSTWKSVDRFSTLAYWDLLASCDLDLMIAPLEPTLFNRTKSYLKVMEAGLLGIPIIASRIGPYIQYVNECSAPQQSDKPIALAGTDREWYEHFVSFIIFPDQRQRIGQANRKYVEQAHCQSNRIGAWVAMLDSLTASVAA